MRALSTGKSEFYAITKGSAHSLHSQALLKGFGVVVEAVVLSDASAGIGRLKHLEVVKSTSPTTENGYENCIYSMNNIHMSNEDNKHDTNYINKHNDANHDTRKLHT